jgi:hypothetical protein
MLNRHLNMIAKTRAIRLLAERNLSLLPGR